MKKAKEEKAQKIERAIRLVWSSLSSHLKYTHHKDACKKDWEGHEWHQACIREYAEVIKILSELYD